MKKLAVIFLGLLAALPAGARIKLVALPDRDTTMIRLDNPAATVVEEERVLTLQKGLNQVDFSWKGVTIDQDSIRLAVLSPADKVQLLNVSYPPGEGALVWQLSCAEACNAKVRISYLLSGIDRLVTYTGTAEKDESKLDLESFLVLRNFSGEDFIDAQVRLDYGEPFSMSAKHEETRQRLFLSKTGLPIVKTFKWDAREKPWDPSRLDENVGIPVYYAIANTEAKGLGENALWDGKVRVFQKDGHGSTIFVGEDNPGFVPVGEDLEIRVGEGRDVVVTQRQKVNRQINIKRNSSNDIILYDNEELIETEVENFKDQPAVLVLTQYIPGEWTMREASLDYELKDHETLEFRVELKPKDKITLKMDFVRSNIRTRDLR
ncbi:MAG TPA: hypothetical protein P5567_12765 [Kiritimatiellia bacterium]|nr:hypothetical protein [Kiritimatiellia bacterium]HRZ13313.1 hypothetical protein [Kiritimatiellia bacterium]HSA18762.1 hypothetical protein [Kiritimatiellia bacterium]